MKKWISVKVTKKKLKKRLVAMKKKELKKKVVTTFQEKICKM